MYVVAAVKYGAGKQNSPQKVPSFLKCPVTFGADAMDSHGHGHDEYTRERGAWQELTRLKVLDRSLLSGLPSFKWNPICAKMFTLVENGGEVCEAKLSTATSVAMVPSFTVHCPNGMTGDEAVLRICSMPCMLSPYAKCCKVPNKFKCRFKCCR